ncbi:glycosyltransferase [Providencia rettgeri]
MKKNTICVVIPIYKGTEVSSFLASINSIINQSLPPDEIIVIYDGYIPSLLEGEVKSLSILYENITILKYLDNKGPGYARDFAIRNTCCTYIAIMDADDISLPERLSIQYNFMEDNENVSLCGGLIQEVDDKNNPTSLRRVPLLYSDILKTVSIKSPVNNVTAFFKRVDYIESGGYPYIRSSEDYALWCRFLSKKKIIINLNSILVNVKFDREALTRRGGVKHFKNDLFTQNEMLNSKLISHKRYIINILKYFIFRCLLTNTIKHLVYKFFLRTK